MFSSLVSAMLIVTMKKMMSWNTTSIIGVMFRSHPSLSRFLLMGKPPEIPGAPAYSATTSTLRRSLMSSIVVAVIWRMMRFALLR